MSEYQWKLTIVERNLVLFNWDKLMPEAQEQMLWEADDLMEDLPLPERQRLLASLESLESHTDGELQQKIQRILNNHLNLEIRNSHQFNPTLSEEGLGVGSSSVVAYPGINLRSLVC